MPIDIEKRTFLKQLEAQEKPILICSPRRPTDTSWKHTRDMCQLCKRTVWRDARNDEVVKKVGHTIICANCLVDAGLLLDSLSSERSAALVGGEHMTMKEGFEVVSQEIDPTPKREEN